MSRLPPSEETVERAMHDLEQRVRQRRSLLGETARAASTRDELRQIADHWHISAHLPITWETPLIGRALALAKRVVRLLLRWYINPIVDQQNEVNASVARGFVLMAAQQDELARAIAELEQRVAALEGRDPKGRDSA